MDGFSIGQIAKKAGVSASTIRYYERIGLLPRAKRVSGKRRYELKILRKIRLIRLARDAGLSIADVQQLVNEFPDDIAPSRRWQALATHKIPELEAQIRQLQKSKAILEQTLECDCATLDDCGDYVL